MKRSICFGLLLCFAFALTLSFSFHLAATASEGPPAGCTIKNEEGDCCIVPGSSLRGVCEFVGGNLVCRCDCTYSPWMTCQGPNNCPLDCNYSGGGS